MASVKSLFKLFSTRVTWENADHLWSLWINPVTYLIPHSIMHGDDSWRENKNTHGLWNKHPFNPFKQAAMSLCHDSSHNNLHRHYPGSVAMASAPSVVATFEGGSLGCFIPRKKFPRCRWHDFKLTEVNKSQYQDLCKAVVQMDRIFILWSYMIWDTVNIN